MSYCKKTAMGNKNEDFNELLSSISKWYDWHGYLNQLKIMYSCLVPKNDELYAATNVFELFEVLGTSGNLGPTNINILYDTINITKPFGLEQEISQLMKMQRVNVWAVGLSKVTLERQTLIDYIKSLKDVDVKKIAERYNCSQIEDRWKLFVELEQRQEFCEDTIESFMSNIIKCLKDDVLEQKADNYGSDTRLNNSNVIGAKETNPLQENNELTDLRGDNLNLQKVTPSETISHKSIDTVNMVTNMTIQDNQGSVTGSQIHNSQIKTVNMTNYIYTTVVTEPKGTQGETDVSDIIIRRYLKERQETLLSTVHRLTPPTWNSEYEIDLTKMFTELVLFKDNRKNEDRTTKPCTLQGLFNAVNSLESCKVLIEGDGGMGKTTLLKHIAHRWATQDEQNSFKEKIVFLINIKGLEQGEDVLDAIMNQIKLKDFNRKTKSNLENKNKLEDFIINHDNEILILLDGYDELDDTFTKDNPILSLFKKTDLKRCNVILTSRSVKLGEFVKLCNIHVKVKGFNKKNIKKYIQRYFTVHNKRALGKSLLKNFRFDFDYDECTDDDDSSDEVYISLFLCV